MKQVEFNELIDKYLKNKVGAQLTMMTITDGLLAVKDVTNSVYITDNDELDVSPESFRALCNNKLGTE